MLLYIFPFLPEELQSGQESEMLVLGPPAGFVRPLLVWLFEFGNAFGLLRLLELVRGVDGDPVVARLFCKVFKVSSYQTVKIIN